MTTACKYSHLHPDDDDDGSLMYEDGLQGGPLALHFSYSAVCEHKLRRWAVIWVILHQASPFYLMTIIICGKHL